MAEGDVPMSVRRLVVEIDPKSVNVRALCAEHGISTWFFYDLRRRFAREGEVVLEPRSRAPRRVANRTGLAVEDAIVAERKRLVDLGLDAGAATIAFHLADLPGLPSESTIWRILKQRGFIEPDPSKAPRASRSFAAARANECWQIDDFTFELADATAVKVINVLDDCSRLSVALHAVASCTAQAAIDALVAGGQRWGLPARLLSDNARAFRHSLAAAAAALGIGAGHSRPYHPQTCGKVERCHQTIRKFLAAQPAPTSLAELQHRLDRFQDLYNHHRPHRGINRRLPIEVWTNTPKAGPANRPLNTPTRTYRGTVAANGVAPAGRYLIRLGAAHAHQPYTAITTGTTTHVFTNGQLARQLTLNPTQRHQPLHPPTVREVPRHQ
jgi:transposase InsO family protein